MSQVLYSLKMNGGEVVSVEMDVPDFLPRAPKIDREWLKGIVTEQVRKMPARKKPRMMRLTKHAVAA